MSPLLPRVNYEINDSSVYNNARVVGPGTSNAIASQQDKVLVDIGGSLVSRFIKGPPTLHNRVGRGDRDFTLSLWVYLDELTRTQGLAYHRLGQISTTGFGVDPTHRTYFCLWYDQPLNRFKVAMAEEVNPNVNVQTYVDQYGNTATHGTIPAINTWYQIVVTWDASTDTLGINVDNGTPVTAVITPEWDTDNFPIDFGADPPLTGFFPQEIVLGGRSMAGGGAIETADSVLRGRLALPYSWARELTGAELTSIYNAGSGLRYSEF